MSQQATLVETADGLQAVTASYIYTSPPTSVGANKPYFVFFNGVGSGKIIDVRGVWIVPKIDVAVTGALGIRVDVGRVSAAGTGGTLASYKSAVVDVAGGNISPLDTDNPGLPSQLEIRWLPTGGGTVSEWLLTCYSFGEETATQACTTQYDNILPVLQPTGQRLILREGYGLGCRQGAVASAGSISFLLAFTIR